MALSVEKNDVDFRFVQLPTRFAGTHVLVSAPSMGRTTGGAQSQQGGVDGDDNESPAFQKKMGQGEEEQKGWMGDEVWNWLLVGLLLALQDQD